MKNLKIELYGVAFLNGVLKTYEHELSRDEIQEIIDSKSFTWIADKDVVAEAITNELTDEKAFEVGDADLCLIVLGEKKTDSVLPSQVKEELKQRFSSIAEETTVVEEEVKDFGTLAKAEKDNIVEEIVIKTPGIKSAAIGKELKALGYGKFSYDDVYYSLQRVMKASAKQTK